MRRTGNREPLVVALMLTDVQLPTKQNRGSEFETSQSDSRSVGTCALHVAPFVWSLQGCFGVSEIRELKAGIRMAYMNKYYGGKTLRFVKSKFLLYINCVT